MSKSRSRKQTANGSPSVWENYYDVVVLPPDEARDHCIALSRQLQPFGSFILGRRRYLPHISLYHIPVRPAGFEAFAETVAGIASTHSGGQLKFVRIEMPVLQTTRPVWLMKLHREIVRQTVRCFDWEHGAHQSWEIDYLPAGLRSPAKRYIREYGSPFINEVFRPHVTLTSLANDAACVLPTLNVEPLRFPVDRISICELGPSHSCQRIVTTFQLKGSTET